MIDHVLYMNDDVFTWKSDMKRMTRYIGKC